MFLITVIVLHLFVQDALMTRLPSCTCAAVVMKDRTTGRPRGFGFVTFKDAEVADRVVQDIHVIDGRQVRVDTGAWSLT